jgi:hypothetical protein
MLQNASTKENKSQQINCPGEHRPKRHRETVFHEKGNLTFLATRPRTDLHPTLYETEGTLEMERMLLRAPASKENTAKGHLRSASQVPGSVARIGLDHREKEKCLMLWDT